MKLFPKDDSEIGDNQSDESDLFSSSDDDDFVDYANKTPSPIVEMPRTPSPSKKNDGLESDQKEGYSSDYETKEENSTDKGEYNTSMDTATRRSQETPTCAALEHNRNIDLELAKKIINLRERSARGPEYQRTSDAPKNLGSQFRSTIQESLKKEPIKESTGADQEVQPAQLTNGKVDSVYEEDRSTSSVETCNLATLITAGGRDTTNVLVNGIEVAKDDNVKVESASRSPEPPADTSNDNKGNMAKQAFVERLLPRDLPIKYPQVAIKLPTSPTPTRSSAANKSLTATPKRSAISYKRDTNVAGRLIAPASGPTAFPPSPTRFVRKNSTPAANGADQQIRPASSIGSNSETTPAHETRKLPAYTGNENSRYGLPAEEKAKLKQERERAKREKEEKARREEEEKRRRKQDAQKTFEAWLRNKNAEIENNKKAVINSTASCRKKTLSPQPPLLNEQSQNEATANSNTTVTFLTWLKGKNMQEKQRKLQEKLQQIEIEEFKRKHTRQDAQQAYKRWLRKKALESEHRRISQRHRAVEERLSSSPSKSKEVLDRFFESEHFASLNRKQQDNLIQRNSKFTVLNGNA
ncbi:coiled-coil domain-containing protein 181-like [Varroa jacobsoni]|uniref:coiled-coil domain-containing protein 181-like n=1 Tax=Varroa jacobsoni TaxID=62625 RepID=UPI000BF9DF19|nr:coiled-coil domain-containing protein 181-like [Varroa jacobsoni]